MFLFCFVVVFWTLSVKNSDKMQLVHIPHPHVDFDNQDPVLSYLLPRLFSGRPSTTLLPKVHAQLGLVSVFLPWPPTLNTILLVPRSQKSSAPVILLSCFLALLMILPVSVLRGWGRGKEEQIRLRCSLSPCMYQASVFFLME